MYLLFTRSNSIMSRLIRSVTGEPVSHVAVSYGDLVIHSNLLGVRQEFLSTFTKHSTVVYSLEVSGNIDVWEKLKQYEGSTYDFGALFYLLLLHVPVIRSILPSNKNLWQSTSMFLCTEWAITVTDGEEDSVITPYQLYLRKAKK